MTVTSLSGRVLPLTAAAVLFGLTLFGIYANVRPITATNAEGPAEFAVPFWEPVDEGPKIERSGDAPTPILLPTPAGSSPLEDEEAPVEPIDRWAGERLEATSKESSEKGSKEPGRVVEGSDPLRGAFGSPAARPVGPAVLSEVEHLPSQNAATTWPQDPAELPAVQYPDAASQWTPPLTPPIETPVDTETSLEAPPDSPTDAATSDRAPPGSPTDRRAASRPPMDTRASPRPPAPSNATAPSRSPMGLPLPRKGMAHLG